MKVLIQNGTLLTMDAEDQVLEGDLLIEDGEIIGVGQKPSAEWARDAEVVDARGGLVLPGFVQTHVHLCQTLFRGLADDLALIDWLKTRIWPMEAAHDEASIQASARLTLVELLRSGTTSFLDMGTVNHTDALIEAVHEAGVRAVMGKCMMDAGDEVPPGLQEETAASLRASDALCDKWNYKKSSLIGYAYSPRFALSCTDKLLREVGERAKAKGAMIHTHASETQFEVETTLREHGLRNIHYLHQCGLTGPKTVFAHGVWLDEAEIALLAETQTGITHCPNTNLKLGSGIANIPLMRAAGVRLGIGSDGAPCNNTLDAFTEMRTAALIQKPAHGPTAMPAREVLRMQTIEGARLLGIDDKVGSLEVGKRADVTVMKLAKPHLGVAGDPAARLVYSAFPEDVDAVLVDGVFKVRGGEIVALDLERVLEEATRTLSALAKRAGVI